MSESAAPTTDTGAAPAETAKPEPEATPKEGAPEKTGLSADEAAELNRLRKIHEDESKWEKRAKQNFDDAKRFRELVEQLGGKETKEFDAKAAFEQLNAKLESAEQERIRAEVARVKNVDPEDIQGKTEEEMNASADRWLARFQARLDEAMKSKAPTTPPASTVTSDGKISGPEQITSRDELSKMSPAQRLKAYQEGRLNSLMGKSS